MRTDSNTIQDKWGRHYSLRVDGDSDAWNVRVSDENRSVGHAYCIKKQSSLQLMDLRIYDQVCAKQSDFMQWTRAFLKLPRKVINYRRMGLGGALLEYVIEHARHKGMREIHGDLSDNDTVNFRELGNWYGQRGFKYSPEGGLGAGTIHMTLEPAKKEPAVKQVRGGQANSSFSSSK